MLIDLEQVAVPFSQPRRAAVCIAGAGVAGLVLATSLADAGIDIHLLEAGGRTLEARSQDIYDAEMGGTKHAGTTGGRFRVFGGSSTRWGGQLLPYAPEVFSSLRALSYRNWPIAPEELEPFYPRIEQLLGTNHLPFTTDLCKSLGIAIPCDFDKNPDVMLRFSKRAPFSHRNLAQNVGKRAFASPRVAVFLHANLVECMLSPNGEKIEAFLVRNYKGDQFRFEAEHYVLATGTIETSRLLLASRAICGQGVGNKHDQVGRGLHDHVSASIARPAGEERYKLLSWFGPFLSGATTHIGRLEATPALRERLDLLAVQAHLTIEEPEDSGAFMARHLLRAVQRGDFRSAVVHALPRIPKSSWELARLILTARVRKRRAVSPKATVSLEVVCEQQAKTHNRIRLADHSRDALGMQKAVVDWRVSPEEIRSILCFGRWLQEEFQRLGLRVSNWAASLRHDENGRIPQIRDTNHPMGGTIMGRDPAHAVVDNHLKVHGLLNLWVASCSTFPTGGSSNPTFTLIALTLRLAERLRLALAR